jgi:hypothetical protein
MIRNLSRNLWFLLLACSIFVPCGYAQDLNLSVQLTTGQEQILPYEAVGVLCEISNQTKQPVSVEGYNGKLKVAIRRSNTLEWEQYRDDPNTSSPPIEAKLPTRIFRPTEVNTEFIWLGADYTGNSPFSDEGVYEIDLDIHLGGKQIKKLQVVKPIGEDAKALPDVVNAKLYRLFTMKSIQQEILRQYFDRPDSTVDVKGQSVEQQIVTELNQKLQSFINEHPTSRYADWARWGQLLLKSTPHGSDWPYISEGAREYLPEAKLLRQNFETLAPSLFPYLRANAWFRAGVLATITGDSTGAKELFTKAVALQADRTIEKQIALVQRQVVERPGLVYRSPVRTAKDVLNNVIQKLTDERFDLNALKTNPAKQKEYYVKLAALLNQFEKREITEDEYYLRRSQLLDLYIRQYTRPLTEEEFKKRKK